MRLVIVSEDIPDISGVYLAPAPVVEKRKEEIEKLVRLAAEGNWSDLDSTYKSIAAAAAGTTAFWATAGATAILVGGPIFWGIAAITSALAGKKYSQEGLIKRLPEMLGAMYETGQADALQTRNLSWAGDETVTVHGATISKAKANQPSHRLSFEDRCITILPVQGRQNLTPASPLLVGMFSSDEQIRHSLDADGGTSRIHVINRMVGREVFKRHGGGVLEDGLYAAHPKREGVLVPFQDFHNQMLQEMNREINRVMGRIGAKKMTIETLEGMTTGGKMASSFPKAAGEGSFSFASQEERTVTREWTPPTFDFSHALDDCVWIQDNAAAMTIVDQRMTSSLVTYEERSTVDTSFRLDLEVMRLFNANFNWASKSSYRYALEFFPKA